MMADIVEVNRLLAQRARAQEFYDTLCGRLVAQPEDANLLARVQLAAARLNTAQDAYARALSSFRGRRQMADGIL